MCITNLSVSQTKSIDTAKFNTYYHRLEYSRILEYEYSQPPAWTNFIPSIAVTTILVNDQIKAFPNLSISIGQFLNAKKEQSKINTKIRSLRYATQLEKERDLKKIQTLQTEIQSIKTEQQLKTELLQIQQKIYQYDSTRYTNHEINPDQYYRSKASIITEQYNLQLIRQKLQAAKSQLNQLLHQ